MLRATLKRTPETALKYRDLHSWDVTPKRAVEIQRELRNRIVLRGDPGNIRTVAGADCALDPTGKYIHAAILVYRFPELTEVERQSARRKIQFPYIPGLLSFREAPVLLAAFSRLKTTPDVILFDGQGWAHPRRMGIACHLGLFLDRPTIGCAKSRLIGEHAEPGQEKGSRARLVHRGEVIGSVVRTRKAVRPVFVSVGHRIDLETAVEITLRCTDGLRIPKPAREADRLAGELKRIKPGT